MPEINPLDLIAECIEKCKGTTDREQVAHHLSETLGLLQIENPEDDAGRRDHRGGTDRQRALRGSVRRLDRARETASDPVGRSCHDRLTFNPVFDSTPRSLRTELWQLAASQADAE